MTYILGSVCQDGIVLIGDRKITGADYPWEPKIFMDAPNIVAGSSGVYALFDKYRARVVDFMASQAGRTVSIQSILAAIEDATAELNNKYSDRVGGRWFDVLVATRTNRGAFLQYVIRTGVAEPVKTYKAIGHGEPYGAVFLKTMWRPEMTMDQIGELRYFIIRYIERLQLDDSVGVGDNHPQIWFIPRDLQKPITQASPELLNDLRKRVEEKITEFESGVKHLFSAKPSV